MAVFGKNTVYTLGHVVFIEEVDGENIAYSHCNCTKIGGITALYTASGTSAEIVKFLLEHGAEVDAMVWNKSTPLLNAASYGLTDAVELLANAGGNLNAKTDLGDTALIRAAIMGQTQTVEWLINHGADVNERKK